MKYIVVGIKVDEDFFETAQGTHPEVLALIGEDHSKINDVVALAGGFNSVADRIIAAMEAERGGAVAASSTFSGLEPGSFHGELSEVPLGQNVLSHE